MSTEGQDGKKDCKLCALKIPTDAVVCHHCQLHQGYFRRNTAYWVSVLSLLVALAAISNSTIDKIARESPNKPGISLATIETSFDPIVSKASSDNFGFPLSTIVINESPDHAFLDEEIHCISSGSRDPNVPDEPHFLTFRRGERSLVAPNSNAPISWGLGDWMQLDTSNGGFLAETVSDDFYEEVLTVLTELREEVATHRSTQLNLEFSCYFSITVAEEGEAPAIRTRSLGMRLIQPTETQGTPYWFFYEP